MPADAPGVSAVELALANAERMGFRLAVIGRTGALVAIAVFYLAALSYPSNIYVASLTLAISAVGLAPLPLAGTPYERTGRYALFAFDATAISIMLAVAPLTSGGEVPQNLVFTSRPEYYYLVVVISVLMLIARSGPLDRPLRRARSSRRQTAFASCINELHRNS